MTIRDVVYDQVEHKVTKEQWPGIVPKLTAMSDRIGAMLDRRKT